MQVLLPSLVELEIFDCPKLEPFLKGGLPSQLKSLFICGCQEAIAGLVKRDFRALPNNEVESIAEETLLPSSLTYLKIWNFDNLKHLELHHLTSLKTLRIRKCPNLQRIAKEKLSSLSELMIDDCPLLSQQAQHINIPNICNREHDRVLHEKAVYKQFHHFNKVRVMLNVNNAGMICFHEYDPEVADD
ncbi:hypothetical protein GH714_017210 [Hevea brasiliensis]|uniref:Uncharacterized protein n=1 Tax=Hevea brasiliensis TaxID=3981 RepID=A0A6A6NC38_HEVBR|nr:hypothetical protein GH714_017210 [Hevea brasiliensis]